MKFHFYAALIGQLITLGASEFTEEPPTTADPSTVQDCTWWFVATASDTCASIASSYGLTQAQLIQYNPILATSCTFIVGNSYCIEENWGAAPAPTSGTSTTATSTTSPTTTAGNGVSTPTPTQDGMTSDCNKFYFVQANDGCAKIASDNGINLSDFYTWNPAVGNTCAGLWANVYVCVGVLGGSSATTTATTTTPTTTTTAGNGITTPTPTQPGMVSNCNKFDFVESGTACSTILSRNSISLAQLYAWNSGVSSDCSGLWASVYVCVGVVGQTTTLSTSTTKTTATTTTTAGNGVATPTPYQAGMTASCDVFHLVVADDSCWAIANDAGITLDQFYAWNPTVGTDCSSLWLGYYVCISLI